MAGQTAANTNPLSSAPEGQPIQTPISGKQGAFLDQIMKGLPSFSETLPPKRDSFGEPLWANIGLITTGDADLVEAELTGLPLRLVHGIRPPAATRNGVDLRELRSQMAGTPYDRYQGDKRKPRHG